MAKQQVNIKQIYNPYRCSVYSANAQLNIGQNVTTRVNFNTVIYDPASSWVLSPDYVYVAPVTGYYHVSCRVQWLQMTAGENVATAVSVSGVNKLTSDFNVSPTTYANASFVNGDVYMTAGQYLEVTTKHDAATSTPDIAAGIQTTYLQIHLISI